MRNTKEQIHKNFYPILASSGNESINSLLDKWDKFDALSEINQNKVSSLETAEKVRQISTTFNLNDDQSAPIAIAIRKYYFGELTADDMTAVLAREIPIDQQKAREIMRLVIEKIINDKSQEIAYQAQLDKLPLNDALKLYPELGEQLITSDKINLRNFPEPVRPSLKNWLADYTFTIGYDNKDSIKRGNYIFHGQNTLRLSAADRDKLAYVLKTHDDGSEVTVNKNLKQLVFPATASAPAPFTAPINRPSDSPIQNPAYRPLSVEPRRAEVSPTRQPAAQFPGRTFPPASGQSPSFKKPESTVPPAVKSVSPQNSASLHGAVRFSSAQKLPFEKINPVKSLPQQPVTEAVTQKIQPAPQPAAVNVKPQPARPAPQAVPDQRSGNVKSSPYIIRPVFSKAEEPKDSPKPLPKNVVNLKDNLLNE